MSQVYATEPSTSGRVILETTHGSLEIQLWCRECPATTRFFLQLCLDGFFDEMLFHRIVPDFLIQTGAVRQGKPSNPEHQEKMMEAYRHVIQADEALARRKYEVHSRLRFNHRGQVAMALGVSDDENVVAVQPQFFVTLEEAPYLDGKHVLFGTVTGPTMFNALRIGRTEVDEDTSTPVHLDHAPRIQSIKILDNPIFSDLTPQITVPWKTQVIENDVVKLTKKRRKGKKDVNVLSFGDEFEEDNYGDTGIKSSHDVIGSDVLSKQVDWRVQQAAVASLGDVAPNVRTTKRVKGNEDDTPHDSFSAPFNNNVVTDQPTDAKPDQVERTELSAPQTQAKSVLPQEPLKASFTPSSESVVEARRAKYTSNSLTNKKQREEDTMAKLMAFQSKVRKQVSETKAQSNGKFDLNDNSLASRLARKAEANSPPSIPVEDEGRSYHGQVMESDDENAQGIDWIATQFQCHKHMDYLARARGGESAKEGTRGGDGRHMDDYEVIDEKSSGDRGHDERHKRDRSRRRGTRRREHHHSHKR